MGWTAANAPLSPASLVLPSALFIWQIPHFLALAWMHKKDYAAAGYMMLPKIDPLGVRTGRYMLRYSLLLVPLGYGAWAAGLTTAPFAAEAGLLGAYISYHSLRFARSAKQRSLALKTFYSSLYYLPLLMVMLVVHRIPMHHQELGVVEQDSSSVIRVSLSGLG